jgi:dihydrofolate synthase/folylpolyglutamate synthase
MTAQETGPFSSYQQTLDYLYSRLPMFSRIGAGALKADLKNTLELCRRIGNPQHQFKAIHIGGTNGKGSTSHMLAAILQTAGYRTGLYTSPHLKDFRERIRINGSMIPEQDVVAFINNQHLDIEELSPSFFELTVAMAFHYFALQKVDIAVIEVGLGGRLDSTNVISPLLSVITNIGYDHVNILGNTLPEIAFEKAGIIKSRIPVVIGEKHPETTGIFLKKVQETQSPLSFASDEWIIEQTIADQKLSHLKVKRMATGDQAVFKPESLTTDLTGLYQLKNIATVLSALTELRKAGLTITDDQVQTALKQVKSLTGLKGRWQFLHEKPLIICDTGHNEDGIREVLAHIRAMSYRSLHIVLPSRYAESQTGSRTRRRSRGTGPSGQQLCQC